MARGKYRGRGGGRGGGRRPQEGESSGSEEFERRPNRGQAATAGMLPPSDSESGSEAEEAPPGGQNPNVGLLPPSDSEEESESGGEGEDGEKAVAKKPLVPAVPDAARRKKEEDLDPEQMREDMERLELVKRRREEQRLERIAKEGWDRFAPLCDTNRPPLPSDFPGKS